MDYPERISYTQLTTWLECGKKWYFSKLARLPEKPAWWNIGGRVVHKASEWVDELSTAERQDAAFRGRMVTMYRDLLDQEIAAVAESEVPKTEWRTARAGKEWPGGANEAWWRHHGPDMVQRWADWRTLSGWDLAMLPDGPAVEVDLQVQFNENVPPVQMYIDRLFVKEGRLVVVDLKAGSTQPKSDLQLGVYSAGLEVAYGAGAATGYYWMARTGKLVGPFDLTRYTPQLLGLWTGQFWAAVKDGIFVPKLGDLCKFCAFNDYCLAFGGRKAEGVDPDYAFGVSVA